MLCFKNNHTELYEIKVGRSDFLADVKKVCREKWKRRGFFTRHAGEKELVRWKVLAPELMHVEKPHLGKLRYYVCPAELIYPNELSAGWGLYWFKNNKFYKKKSSGNFQRNIHDEIAILTHAMRKYASGDGENILVNTYSP